MGALKAFGGAPLCGGKLVRIAYLAETGISRDERFVVVAAVMFAGDDWPAVQKGLSDLADHSVRPDRRAGFVFHAQQLYRGSKTFPRAEYMPEHGREVLKSLLHIPKDNGMPVVFGWADKRSYSDRIDLPAKQADRDLLFHAIAFCEALVMIDKTMRDVFPSECVQVVVEDHQHHRKVLKEVYRYLASEESKELLSPETEEWLPIRKVIDVPNFAAKTDSSPLQLADAAAWAIRRHIERREDAAEYFDLLRPALRMLPKMEAVSP
jgi:hypothetical protein